ncbi:MAG: Hsp20/alpha crystallin family protein [Candidatus Omnitrophota bacterium]
MLLNTTNKQKEPHVVAAPCVNIYEMEKHVELAVEMPGMDKKSLEVLVEGSTLKISGRKHKDEIGKEYVPIHQERTVTEYEREFELNMDVDSERISAEYKDGVLKVLLAKSEKVIPKKIEIRTQE